MGERDPRRTHNAAAGCGLNKMLGCTGSSAKQNVGCGEKHHRFIVLMRTQFITNLY